MAGLGKFFLEMHYPAASASMARCQGFIAIMERAYDVYFADHESKSWLLYREIPHALHYGFKFMHNP